jgi:hypothetical protein
VESAPAEATSAGDPPAASTPADGSGETASSTADPAPAVDLAGQGSTGAPSPDQGNPGHPAQRPTLPAKAKGTPPADPGSATSIPRSGDDTNAS